MEDIQDAGEIEHWIKDTLQDAADTFDNRGESQAVLTHHVRISTGDLAHLVNTGEPIEIDGVTIIRRSELLDDIGDGGFVILLSNKAIERLADGQIVDYGISHVGGENKYLIVSAGGVSDKLEKETPPLELEKQEHPELRD